MKMNTKEMLNYFGNFNSFEHKYFIDESSQKEPSVLADAVKLFGAERYRSTNLREVAEIFQTMDKVYHYGSSGSFEEMNLLEQAADKFLIQYVDIDGLQELFRPSFFNFEWMMHLEYVKKKQDYSYYRDHYMHQIRNMYEMFMLLDKKGMWKDCMAIYKQRKNTVANRMAKSVVEQQHILSTECKRVLEKSFGDVEEWCYHYIIFATAIVSALVHDIGYPITFMKRNLNTIQDFLPLTYMFMGINDGIPKIKSLLSGSLLFETVDSDEIIERLNKDDHGAYSSIILLCHYYDNGKIFNLEPVQRMIIELSALVIYNHTLRHHFQEEKNYDRYQNVFVDNPISYLFRLCDDMQEWDRVYFEITGKGNFFICDRCKQPMLRYDNENHYNESKGENLKYGYEYVCSQCGARAVNTVLFPYRRMMNVAPFTEAVLESFETDGKERQEGGSDDQDKRKIKRREDEKWILELKCSKGELLQLARYNSNFAIQRAKGIRELRGLVCGQAEFPRVFVKSFISNNPIAIKVEILREFIQRNTDRLIHIKEKRENAITYKKMTDTVIQCSDVKLFDSSKLKMFSCDEERFSIEYRSIMSEIRDKIKSTFINTTIYDIFEEKSGDQWNVPKMGKANIRSMLKNRIAFYLFLLIFGSILRKMEFGIEDEGKAPVKDEKKERQKYERALDAKFMEYANEIVRIWKIADSDMTVLIADCLICMYAAVSDKDYFEKESTFRNNLRIPLRADMREILKRYTRKPDPIMKRNQIYDFWSDYYFFHIMDWVSCKEEDDKACVTKKEEAE